MNADLTGTPGGRARLPTPCLVVDLDVLEKNLERAQRICRNAGLGLRPHTKGHKCVELARRQLAEGAIGLCCTTLAEAERMAASGSPSLLLTSPVNTDLQIARLLALAEVVPEVIVTVDDERIIDALDDAAGRAGQRQPVLIDIDVGQRRTGAPDPESLLTLATAAAKSPNLVFMGVQAYYGHLQAIADFDERARRAGEAQAYVERHIAALKARGLAPSIVSGGGTGTVEIDAASGLFTELQLGSYALFDATYRRESLSKESEPLFYPSLLVRGRVISVRQPDRVTIDVGMKAMSTDQGPGELASPKGLDAAYAFAGDEHGFLFLEGVSAKPELGDVIELIPGHCDTTTNLHAVVHAVRGNDVEEVWPILARGFW